MNKSQSLLPFMDILTSLVGIIILMTIIFALSITESKTVEVRIVHKKEDAPQLDQKLRPVYVICEAGRIKIGENEFSVPKTAKEMQNLKNTLETEMQLAGEGAFLFALMRPDGYEAFRGMRKAVDKLGFRLGYEPINSTWKLVRQ